MDAPPIFGLCPVCGEKTQFRDWTDNLRETGICTNCGASNRHRQIAFTLRWALQMPQQASLDLPIRCHLYNTESRGPLHEALRRAAGYVCSEYWGHEYTPGTQVNGVRHEDLEQLSFASGSLDFVLSSDVLEHVPDAYRAHTEIFRVLRHGGWHIFTVPFNYADQDEVRAVRAPDGTTKFLADPEYHGDPIRAGGALVFRIFGREMMHRVQEIGYSIVSLSPHEPRFGIVGNVLVFAAYKP